MTAVAALSLASAASAGAATRILAVGDFGVGGKTERRMGAAMKAWEADHPANLLLTLGDNDYTESPRAFRRNWSDAFGWLSGAGVWVRGTLGNHDVRVRGEELLANWFGWANRALEATGIQVESAELTMLPRTTVQIEEEAAARKLLRLMDALEENDDVQDVYANFDIPEGILEAVA
mgnify:CR=1 FL=1